MAFWQRKSNNRVFVYTSQQGRQRTLKRDLVRHLDHEPDHNVEAWVRQYEDQYEGKQASPDRQMDPKLRRLLDDYLVYLRGLGKSKKTVADHKRMLDTYILPYFAVLNKLSDPNDWPRISPKLAVHLRTIGQSEHQILRANSALRGFWEYLCDEQVVLGGLQIRVRAPLIRPRPTPLQRVLEPSEVLEFARKSNHLPCKLMALIGYFFSLRPQETLALRKCDFIAGATAASLECCRVMERHSLYGRLAINVHRQRTQSGDYGPPKAYSLGHVACFSEPAARALVTLLREIKDPEALLFEHQPDWNYELWKRHGIPGLTLKDLRRSSIYWLGHYSSMVDPVALRSHARHKKLDTTMLYLRRPTEQASEFTELDLDA